MIQKARGRRRRRRNGPGGMLRCEGLPIANIAQNLTEGNGSVPPNHPPRVRTWGVDVMSDLPFYLLDFYLLSNCSLFFRRNEYASARASPFFELRMQKKGGNRGPAQHAEKGPLPPYAKSRHGTVGGAPEYAGQLPKTSNNGGAQQQRRPPPHPPPCPWATLPFSRDNAHQ